MAKEIKKNNPEEKKIIPVKNYIILGIMFFIVVILVLYLCNLYHVYDEHQREIPIIRDTLSEIQSDELEHYIMENPTTVIYMCTAENQSCRDFERNFEKLIKKNNLQDSIIYLNLSGVDQDEFVKNFNIHYSSKVTLTKNYPALVAFEDGKVRSILQEGKNEHLDISETEHFIEMQQIVQREE